MRGSTPRSRPAFAVTCALLALTHAGCSGTSSKEPPPLAPSGVARAAYQARGVTLRAHTVAAPDDRFPVIAPDTPFGAAPSGSAPNGTELAPSAPAPPASGTAL